MTVKQRERRRELVKQLKQRKADGKTNLTIIQDKIVVRRQRPELTTDVRWINTTQLETITDEKYLGVYINRDFGIIYKTYVRPHLEYGI